VNDAADIFRDPHVTARGMIAELTHAEPGKAGWRVAANPIHFSKTPAVPLTAPPELGQDNDNLLRHVDRAGTDE
jgi:crotonobetainyl-CoA:carnitine CoA-transferase CaiB-like acyl-CoA transferase